MCQFSWWLRDRRPRSEGGGLIQPPPPATEQPKKPGLVRVKISFKSNTTVLFPHGTEVFIVLSPLQVSICQQDMGGAEEVHPPVRVPPPPYLRAPPPWRYLLDASLATPDGHAPWRHLLASPWSDMRGSSSRWSWSQASHVSLDSTFKVQSGILLLPSPVGYWTFHGTDSHYFGLKPLVLSWWHIVLMV